MPEFRETTLPSGLRIAAEIDRRGYSAAFGYFVGAGARYETDSESGLSHFLEHMMFKGTSRRSAADVNRELDELGGRSNAYTSEEQTVYYATVLPKFQDRIVDLLTDMLGSQLDAGEFDIERKVILEEIAKYEDQPPFGAFERAMEVHFGPRGLGRRVLGTVESIHAMTAEAMRNYFCRYYRPENIVMAASGNVDFDGLVAAVADQTAHWAQRPVPAAPAADREDILPEGISSDRNITIGDANQAYHVRISAGAGMQSDDRYASAMLASIVGDEGGSRLFWELIDTGRADVATVWPQEFSDTGAWLTYLVCAPQQSRENNQRIDDIFRQVAELGVEADELQQAVNKAVAGCIMQSERPSHRLFALGSRWLSLGEYVSTDELLARLRGLDVDQVSAAATRYLSQPSIDIVASADDIVAAADWPG